MAKQTNRKAVKGLPPASAKPIGRPALPASDSSDERLCWRFTWVDHDGPWGFSEVEPSVLCEILTRLADFESMKLHAVFHSGSYPGKDYDVAAIPTRKVLDRLEALGLGDQTKIWALRLGGEPRLYGFLDENIFHIVFWDPRHEIWPSTLRHT